MRVLVIGGPGFIGAHIVRQLAALGHDVAIFHRGQTSAVLPGNVCEIIDPQSVIPIERFPSEVLNFEPEVVILTVTLGAADARAAVDAFSGRARRLVLLSSGDVYLAYGRFTGIEPGPIERGLLTEDSPLRSVLFPYRNQASSPQALEYWYEKILAERALLAAPASTVLRLPKVYGPGRNAELATVYQYRHHPDWRWTHGYVENVAAAVVLAATHVAAGGRIYNAGEAYTPTVAERLSRLPSSAVPPDLSSKYNFSQNIAYDTSRIRTELGYQELVPEEEAALRTLGSGAK